MYKNNKGFTLIEVILAMAILSIVVGIAFSVFSFGNRTFAIGIDSSDSQFNSRFIAGEIAAKVRNATTVTLMDSGEIAALITSGAYDNMKQYIFIKQDPVSGKKSIIHRTGALERKLLGDLEGTAILGFDSTVGSNMLSYSVQCNVDGQVFNIDSKVFLHNMGPVDIVKPASGNPAVAICFGPIANIDAVQLDKTELVPPALANSVTTSLVLPLVGTYGSQITWTSLSPNITIPAITMTDINNGYVTATVTRPAAAPAVTAQLQAKFQKGTYQAIVTYNISILPFDTLALNAPAAITSGTTGIGYTYTLLATGGVGGYSFSGSSLPSGLSLSTSTTASGNVGVLSGTPSTAGSYNMIITVTDSNGSTDTKTVALTIYNSLTITTSSLPDATKNVFYVFNLATSGGNGSITYTGVSLPAGLTLNTNGVLNGTVTNNGNYTVSVKAVDSDGRTATKSLGLQVKNN